MVRPSTATLARRRRASALIRPPVFLALALVLLAACARPLTTGERAFSQDIFGETLNPDSMRIAAGLGLTPPPPPRALPPVSGALKPRPGICDRVPQGPRTEPPPAFSLFQTVHLGRPYYRADAAPGWPARVLLPQALLLAHEMTHVWQWQNRALTGYRPVLAALESILDLDPYYYGSDDAAGFLGFGYEQQAALVEDYVCYALLDPKAPRRAELRAVLAPVFPIDRLDVTLNR